MKGYKKCLDETKTKFVLVELEIPEDAQWFTPIKHVKKVEGGAEIKNIPPKSRASKAKVTKIHGGGKVAYSLHDKYFEYKVGETVKPDTFDPCSDYACSNGIHFFLSKEDAKTVGDGCMYTVDLKTMQIQTFSTAIED